MLAAENIGIGRIEEVQILDEPTASLNGSGGVRGVSIVRGLNGRKMTVLAGYR